MSDQNKTFMRILIECGGNALLKLPYIPLYQKEHKIFVYYHFSPD